MTTKNSKDFIQLITNAFLTQKNLDNVYDQLIEELCNSYNIKITKNVQTTLFQIMRKILIHYIEHEKKIFKNAIDHPKKFIIYLNNISLQTTLDIIVSLYEKKAHNTSNNQIIDKLPEVFKKKDAISLNELENNNNVSAISLEEIDYEVMNEVEVNGIRNEKNISNVVHEKNISNVKEVLNEKNISNVNEIRNEKNIIQNSDENIIISSIEYKKVEKENSLIEYTYDKQFKTEIEAQYINYKDVTIPKSKSKIFVGKMYFSEKSNDLITFDFYTYLDFKKGLNELVTTMEKLGTQKYSYNLSATGYLTIQSTGNFNLLFEQYLYNCSEYLGFEKKNYQNLSSYTSSCEFIGIELYIHSIKFDFFNKDKYICSIVKDSTTANTNSTDIIFDKIHVKLILYDPWNINSIDSEIMKEHFIILTYKKKQKEEEKKEVINVVVSPKNTKVTKIKKLPPLIF